jgi:hypothetical protein
MVGLGDFSLSFPPSPTRLTILFARDGLRFLPCDPLSDEHVLSGVSSLLRPGPGEGEGLGEEEANLPNPTFTGECKVSPLDSLKLWEAFGLIGEDC